MANQTWELDDDRGYLDSPRFAQFCKTVKTAIDKCCKRDKRGATVADIRRELGENCIDRFPYDSFDALKGIGSIHQVTEVSPIRFAPKDVPKAIKYKYDRVPGNPSDKTRPYAESMTGRVR